MAQTREGYGVRYGAQNIVPDRSEAEFLTDDAMLLIVAVVRGESLVAVPTAGLNSCDGLSDCIRIVGNLYRVYIPVEGNAPGAGNQLCAGQSSNRVVARCDPEQREDHGKRADRPAHYSDGVGVGDLPTPTNAGE